MNIIPPIKECGQTMDLYTVDQIQIKTELQRQSVNRVVEKILTLCVSHLNIT